MGAPGIPSEDEQIQIAYDALHDATCDNHGDHCREAEPQLKDAIRVMLWRLTEAGVIRDGGSES